MAMVFGSASVREKEYLFIDGGCLRATVKAMSREIFGNEDAYQPLISAVASGGYDKVFKAITTPSPVASMERTKPPTRRGFIPEHERFDEIQTLDRVHVTLGQIVGKNKRQKGVDVALAIDISLSHAYRGMPSGPRPRCSQANADFVVTLGRCAGKCRASCYDLASHLRPTPLKGAADSVRPFNFGSDRSQSL